MPSVSVPLPPAHSMAVLYSYRRCPYAMRARMALKYAGLLVEIREVSLCDKPAHLLQISSKGTVPVLQLADGSVFDESLSIMRFALGLRDIDGWLNHLDASLLLIQVNDGEFKSALDCYKYPERNVQKSQLKFRVDGEVFLQQLENLLLHSIYLNGDKLTLADIAIFPFIRQFAAIDNTWFVGSGFEIPPYPNLNTWLQRLVNSELFISIMQK